MFDPYFVKVTETMRSDMRLRHEHYGDAFKNHEIEGGKGRIWGTLGELVVGSVLEGATEALTYDFDLVWRDKTWDIKSKTRKDIPKETWDASISASAMHQKVDNYIFVSIIAPASLLNEDEETILNFPYEQAYILGYISKDRFLERATLQIAGSVDKSNGIMYRMNTFTTPYSSLTPFRTLLNQEPKVRPKVFAKFGK